MKKLILKTALITLGVVIILAIAAFGVASLCVPAAMSDLAYSLGMSNISSDYAYQEYERSGDLAYLSRSFELAAANGRDEKAEDRFDILYAADGFGEMCASRDVTVSIGGEEVTYDYRDYVCGLGACVKYRLADSDEALAEAIALAVNETAQDFPAGNPAYTLAVAAAGAGDSAFCGRLLTAFESAGFAQNDLYSDIVYILEDTVNE